MKKYEDIFEEKKHFTGNDVIESLKGMDQSKIVYFDDTCQGIHEKGKYPVNDFYSWRGSYDQSSIGTDGPECYPAGVLINILDDFFDSIQCGWKGGEFAMNSSNRLWCDPEGSCMGRGVSDVVECEDFIFIVVSQFEY